MDARRNIGRKRIFVTYVVTRGMKKRRETNDLAKFHNEIFACKNKVFANSLNRRFFMNTGRSENSGSRESDFQ